MHWAVAYINTPWDRVNNTCWHFVCRVYREQVGLVLPFDPAGDGRQVNFDAGSVSSCLRALQSADRGGWVEVDTPAEFDVVELGKGLSPSHVGVWTMADFGAVIHSLRNAGVVKQSLAAIAADGWNYRKFWRWEGVCSPAA